MFKKTFLTSSIITLAIAAGHANAGGYVGASVGYTDFPEDFDGATSFSATGGYRATENIAIEASYLYLGEAEDDIAPVWEAELTGFNFALVGIAPINDQFELFAKAGMFNWDLEISEEGYGKIGEDDGTDLSFGIGANYYITQEFSLLVEAQRFNDVSDGDLDNISIGARLNF